MAPSGAHANGLNIHGVVTGPNMPAISSLKGSGFLAKRDMHVERDWYRGSNDSTLLLLTSATMRLYETQSPCGPSQVPNNGQHTGAEDRSSIKIATCVTTTRHTVASPGSGSPRSDVHNTERKVPHKPSTCGSMPAGPAAGTLPRQFLHHDFPSTGRKWDPQRRRNWRRGVQGGCQDVGD